MVKNLPANAGDTGSIPGLGRFHMLQGYQAHVPTTNESDSEPGARESPLLKPVCPRAHTLQQEKPPQ